MAEIETGAPVSFLDVYGGRKRLSKMFCRNVPSSTDIDASRLERRIQQHGHADREL
jgi:hypothetical protein